MRLLLDTNIVLFFQQNSDRLSSEWKRSILDSNNENSFDSVFDRYKEVM